MDIVLHAKIEYTKQLQSIVKKPIVSTFASLFEESKLNKDQVLKTFQTKMTQIPNWNQDTIYEKYNQITSKISEELLEKLIQAIIVSNVKIFGSIKKNQGAKIEITLPDNKQFIHKIFVNCARIFYQSPNLFDNRKGTVSPQTITKNTMKISKIIDECVEETIRDVLPFNNILEEYFKEEPEIIDSVPNIDNFQIHEKEEDLEEESVNEEEIEEDDEGSIEDEEVKEINLREDDKKNEARDDEEEDEEFFNN